MFKSTATRKVLHLKQIQLCLHFFRVCMEQYKHLQKGNGDCGAV